MLLYSSSISILIIYLTLGSKTFVFFLMHSYKVITESPAYEKIRGFIVSDKGVGYP